MSRSMIYITAPDMAEARRLAFMLVESRLAACANILPGMHSVYRWQGGVESAEEVVLVVKTRTELVPQLTKAVAAAHSYEVPCVVSWPLEQGHPAFLEWIDLETCAKAAVEKGED